MAGKTTVFQHLMMTHGNDFSEYRLATSRDSIMNSLVDVFKEARRQHSNRMSIGHIEVHPQTNTPLSLDSKCVNITSISKIGHTLIEINSDAIVL